MKIHFVAFELCPCLKIDPDPESRSKATLSQGPTEGAHWIFFNFEAFPH